ncbi:hypothetical protein KXX22_001350 [Aspergillus fumigatus]|nr:hypothetical protein KXX22_001350 [Aspergillus fumigatus]KAH1638015.1 hypothetical protein KXX59_002553 [Aspergillus fumigatus]KAH1774195.1 hypothetical protein KXX62_000660 [Aspergillus fumigatus]KAH1876057.1 hypothetical protein KXX08_008421 [Aspergillus fumigatus]KAH2543697.1 hypothetical protein KXW97_002540 [Aspergillus fumigatus]
MAPLETEVIAALNLLRDTPREILSIHRHLALETLIQIGRVLDVSWNERRCLSHGVEVELGNGSLEDAIITQTIISQAEASSQSIAARERDTNLPGRGTPGLSSTHTLQDATRKRKKQTSSDATRKRKRLSDQGLFSAKLIKSVKQQLPSVLKFCKDNTSLSDILQNKQEMQFADKRVDHLKQVDGNKTPSNEQKLLKGLSQLSLAQQFTAWETEHGWKSKVDTLYKEIQALGAGDRTAATGRAGRMTQFIRDHRYPKSDQNVVRKGIKRGIIQHLFLKLMQQVSTTPVQKRAVQGILARATIFEHALFQSIPILELPSFAKSLLKDYDGNFETMEGARSSDTDIAFISEHEISEWFENMIGDFEMISQTTKRGRRNPLQNTHAPSHVTNESVNAPPQQDDRPSDNSANSSRQANATVYPSIDSHEVVTFSTLPRAELNSQRIPLQSSFMEFQDRSEEDGMLPNTGSHDLAQFSRNTSDANLVLTSNSNSCSQSHELSIFSRLPSSVVTQPRLLVPPPGPPFPSVIPSPLSTFRTPEITPHELSSFSIIPAV